MKTITRTLLFLALAAVLYSFNLGEVASTSSADIKSNLDDKEHVNEISMDTTAINSGDALAGSFVIQSDVYQAVYSSQNYGTFYQIYCKPHIAENNEVIDFLEFIIVNYKGPLNIGFAQNANQKLEYAYKDGVLGLKLVVQGNGSEESIMIDVKDKNINKENFKGLNIYRILERMYDNKKAISENGIFDSEFYTRSGGIESYDEKELVAGLEGYKDEENRKDDFNMERLLIPIIDKEKKVKFLGASRNCYSAKNIVAWN